MTTGRDLARAFYDEAVAAIVGDLPHAAALIGAGSEVLGYDDARSTDHDWGPRLLLLLPDDSPAVVDAVDRLLDERLPLRFAGRPVRFGLTHDPQVRHRVVVARRAAWFDGQLGFDPLEPIGLTDWVGVPTWRLREVVSGTVFHDGDGDLTRTRAALEWYPDDLWRWLLAAQWQRIAQEEAFPGRCAEVGDLLGAGVLVGRLARDVMRLWLLMARAYPPYSKWLGTAFARLPGTEPVLYELRSALGATDWQRQERHLGAALVATARRQNDLALGPAPEPTLRPYFDRPYLVLGADRFAAALRDTIAEPRLRQRPLTGVIDQWVDSTDALGSTQRRHALAGALLAEPS